MITYAEQVALEHIAYRRREGWTWGQIIGEACDCLGEFGLPIPINIGSVSELERAYVAAYASVQHRRLAA
jgi:hypothetical protein